MARNQSRNNDASADGNMDATPSSGAVRTDAKASNDEVGDSKSEGQSKPAANQPNAADAGTTPPEADTAPQGPRYAVAKGKSLTSKRGLLGPGAEVSARDFGGGQERLDALVDAGAVTRS